MQMHAACLAKKELDMIAALIFGSVRYIKDTDTEKHLSYFTNPPKRPMQTSK